MFFSGFVQFFPRAAIFLLYRQLFQVHSRSVRVAIWTGLVFTFLTSAPSLIISLVYLAPRPGEAWEQLLMRHSASDPGYNYYLVGPTQRAASVLVDVFAFVLPLPIIARLHLAPRKKAQLRLLFSTAFLHAEYCIAIVVGSMPAFSTFLKLHVLQSRAFKALRSTFRVSSSSTTNQGSDRGGLPDRPLHGTIGSPAVRKKRRGHYDLTDIMNLDSRYTIQGGEDGDDRPVQPGHILRTMDIRQSDHPRSTDNLV
ncbi:hypothetical protein PG985_000145 [Apiospora marii]|uniref:uncharacterized protein n=1 Tax=Apiospora marii TaxID=335849 RepID=UPI00312DEFA2